MLGRCAALRLQPASRRLTLLSARALSSAPLPTTTHTAPLPSIESARAMPRHVSELSNESIVMLAESSEHAGAIRERLRREIMAVDGVDYAGTKARMIEMSDLVGRAAPPLRAPYKLGILTALVGGWVSLPLVFHWNTAKTFNDMFVTADPPEMGDADTFLEVGSWSWNWMEPPLGTISFFLLCMQFARDQRVTIGMKPFTNRIKEHQANRLCAAFPQYDEFVVRAYAESVALQSDAAEIERDHAVIEQRQREQEQPQEQPAA